MNGSIPYKHGIGRSKLGEGRQQLEVRLRWAFSHFSQSPTFLTVKDLNSVPLP